MNRNPQSVPGDRKTAPVSGYLAAALLAGSTPVVVAQGNRPYNAIGRCLGIDWALSSITSEGIKATLAIGYTAQWGLETVLIAATSAYLAKAIGEAESRRQDQLYYVWGHKIQPAGDSGGEDYNDVLVTPCGKVEDYLAAAKGDEVAAKRLFAHLVHIVRDQTCKATGRRVWADPSGATFWIEPDGYVWALTLVKVHPTGE